MSESKIGSIEALRMHLAGIKEQADVIVQDVEQERTTPASLKFAANEILKASQEGLHRLDRIKQALLGLVKEVKTDQFGQLVEDDTPAL